MSKRIVILLLLLAAATVSCADSNQQQQPQDYPAPVQALREQGVQIVGQFEAPGGLTGYAGIIGRRAIAIYVTADGQHAVIGSLIGADGKVVNRKKIQKLVAGPMSERIWSQLEHSAWVPDGDADAPRVVYVFSDPNCPYCHMFWKRARPWVKSGKVQIRHIMVGLISKTSDNKAAAILTAENPEQALTRNKRNFAEGGIEGMEEIPAEVLSKLIANRRLMRQLGIRGTPGIVFRNDKGRVQFVGGLPPKRMMEKILGPRK